MVHAQQNIKFYMNSIPVSTPVLKVSALFCHYQVLIAQSVVALFKHAILITFSFPYKRKFRSQNLRNQFKSIRKKY
jgi:hypothetical protein